MLTIAGLLAASPASAQFPNIFDSIFGNPPPRPPSDVPGRPPARMPSQPQYIPPPGGGGLPPGPPPSSRIQTEPLPPPPGGASAPPRAPQQAVPGAPLPGGQRPQPASLPPTNETIVEPPPHKIANPTAVFSGLDKITGRIISFDVAINETVRFGALEVTPRACYSRPPTEAPAAPPPPTQRTPAPRTQQLQRPPGQPGQPPLPQQRATQQLPPPPAPLPR
jgi:hypothetical protein